MGCVHVVKSTAWTIYQLNEQISLTTTSSMNTTRLTLTNKNQASYHFQYDKMNRLTAEVGVDKGETTYRYLKQHIPLVSISTAFSILVQSISLNGL